MSTVHNNSRVYTINLIYKFYKTPTTDHYLNETIQKTPINIPNKGTNSFIKKFITKNTHMLREFSKRGIGLIFLTDKTSSISIKKIKTTNVNIRNNELLVTIDFIAQGTSITELQKLRKEWCHKTINKGIPLPHSILKQNS